MYDEILQWTNKYSNVVPKLKISYFKYNVIFAELEDVSKEIAEAYSELMFAQRNFSSAIGKSQEKSRFVIGELRHKYKKFDVLRRKKDSLEEFLRIKYIVPFDSTFLELVKFEVEDNEDDVTLIILHALERFYPPDVLVICMIENFDPLIENVSVNSKCGKIKKYISIVRDLSDEKKSTEEILIQVCELGDYELFERIIYNVKFEVRLFWRLLRVSNSAGHDEITDHLWREISIHSI
jgi:hypothetical protein